MDLHAPPSAPALPSAPAPAPQPAPVPVMHPHHPGGKIHMVALTYVGACRPCRHCAHHQATI
eukprot:5524787-Karenia_brevis.AAC.1